MNEAVCFLLAGWWTQGSTSWQYTHKITIQFFHLNAWNSATQTNKMKSPPRSLSSVCLSLEKVIVMVALALYSIPRYLDSHHTHAQGLLRDYSSIFNTIRPLKLTAKLADLRVAVTTLSLLKDRSQIVRMEKGCWAPVSKSKHTGLPKLFLLSMYNCGSDQDKNIIKYTDEKPTMAWIRGGTRHYTGMWATWSPLMGKTDLVLNLDKTTCPGF